MDLRVIWGMRLRQARRERGLTQLQLARRAITSQQRVSQIERARSLPGDELKVRLARALDQDPNELFALPAPPRQPPP